MSAGEPGGEGGNKLIGNGFRSVVYSNTVTSMAAILKAMDSVLHIPLDDGGKEV